MLSGSRGEVRGGNQYNAGEHWDTTPNWSVINFDFKFETYFCCLEKNKKSILLKHQKKYSIFELKYMLKISILPTYQIKTAIWYLPSILTWEFDESILTSYFLIKIHLLFYGMGIVRSFSKKQYI